MKKSKIILNRFVVVLIIMFCLSTVYSIILNLPCNFKVSQTSEGNAVTGKYIELPVPVMIVPKKIKGIDIDIVGGGAFDWNSQLFVYVPNSIKKIEGGAFANNQDLIYIYISDSVEYIGADSFAYCYSLTGVHMSRSIIKIDDLAFEYCDHLKFIKFPNGLKEIGNSAFYGCPLNNVNLPSSVEHIGHNAFVGIKINYSNSTKNSNDN